MRPLLIASLCLIAALLSSCIDGREEFWLRGDGSGAAEVVYEVPAAAAAVFRVPPRWPSLPQAWPKSLMKRNWRSGSSGGS